MIGCRFTGLTVTVAVPDLDGFWVDVAVIVTTIGDVVIGAVKSPAALMEPALAVHVTVVAKLFPVPVTVALHCTTWPD